MLFYITSQKLECIQNIVKLYSTQESLRIEYMSSSIARDNPLPYEKADAGSFNIKDAQGVQIPIMGKAKLRL